MFEHLPRVSLSSSILNNLSGLKRESMKKYVEDSLSVGIIHQELGFYLSGKEGHVSPGMYPLQRFKSDYYKE